MNNIVRIILILIIVALLGVTGVLFFRSSQMKKFDKQIATVKQNFTAIEQMIADKNLEDAKTQFEAVKAHFQTIKESDVRIPLLPEYTKLNAHLGDRETALAALKEGVALSDAWKDSKKKPFEAALQYLALAEASIFVLDWETYSTCVQSAKDKMEKVTEVPKQIRLNLGMARLCVMSNFAEFPHYYSESEALIAKLPEGETKNTFTALLQELKTQGETVETMLKKQQEAKAAAEAKAAEEAKATPAEEVAPSEVAPVEDAPAEVAPAEVAPAEVEPAELTLE